MTSKLLSLLEALVGSDNTIENSSYSHSKKAFAWARVSTDMREERGLSIPERLPF